MKNHINILFVILSLYVHIAMASPLDNIATGLGLAEDAGAPTVEAIRAGEDDIPFIGQALKTRTLQRLTWNNVKLQLPSALPEFSDTHNFNIALVRDSVSGEQFRISIRPSDLNSSRTMPQHPKPASAERQLREHGERYINYAEPKITLVQALDSVLSCGIGSPYTAAQIEAVPIRWRHNTLIEHDVWIVTLFGIPPLPAHGPHADKANIKQRMHIRNVIDAETGNCIFATNIPHP